MLPDEAPQVAHSRVSELKMRLGHARVRIKHMYNSFFKSCSNLYFVRKSK